MDDREAATRAARWLFRQGVCNGSAVVSPFPVYHQSPDHTNCSGTLSRRARRRIGARGEDKVIGILGAVNHEERRQIRAFLDQQYVRSRDDDTDMDESSEFDRLERRSPLHAAARGTGPSRGDRRSPPRFVTRLPTSTSSGHSQEVVSTASSIKARLPCSKALSSGPTPPQSPGMDHQPSCSSHLDREREKFRGSHAAYAHLRLEERVKLRNGHLPPPLWPRPVPLPYSSNHQPHQQHQQQRHRFMEYPGLSRNTFMNYSYLPASPAPAESEEDGMFSRAHQSPPRRSFTRQAKLPMSFLLSEPQSPYMSPLASPYLSPRTSQYPIYAMSPRATVSISEKLGCGSFSVVYKGEYHGKQVAVKVLHDDELISTQEVTVLSRLDHQNIVKYIGIRTLVDGRRGILLELMKCSLASILKESNGLDENLVRVYTRQILRGLEYLHRMNILHRDIKSANILLDSSGKAKLADFGLAKKIDHSCAKSYKGTFIYMAPEVLLKEGEHYGLAVDVWSLGCTVIEMACGKPPWSGFGMMPFVERMREGQVPPIPSKLSPEATDFVKRCLTREPRRRPSASALLSHPFLQPDR